MLFNKTMRDSLKHIVMEKPAKLTYETLLALKPDSDTKRLEILKEVKE